MKTQSENLVTSICPSHCWELLGTTDWYVGSCHWSSVLWWLAVNCSNVCWTRTDQQASWIFWNQPIGDNVQRLAAKQSEKQKCHEFEAILILSSDKLQLPLRPHRSVISYFLHVWLNSFTGCLGPRPSILLLASKPVLDGISLSLPPNYAKGLKKPLAARRGNPFWVNVGCHDMQRALCGDASAKPTGASIGPLPRLWMHRPQSVREHLCFIPFCVMGAKLLPWMSGVGGGGRGIWMEWSIWALTWKVICGKVQCACWKQKTGPETRIFGNRGPFGGDDPKNIADEVKPFREAFRKTTVVCGKSLKGSPDCFTLTLEVADG